MDKVASAKHISPTLAAFLTCTSALLASAQHSFPAISQHFAKRGEEVSLRCVVDNRDPNAIVYWNRGSTCVAPFIAIGDQLMMHRYSITRKVSTISQSDYYTVTVRNFTERDEGNYTCAVQSGKTGRLFSQIFSVKLVESPKVFVDGLEDNDVVRVRLHTDARIRCRAYGVPTPDVKWNQQRSGELQRPSSSEASQQQVEQNVSILLLNNVNTSLHGSQFECLAHNMVGVARYLIQLFVEVPARLKGASESSIHTAVGNLETLKCTFEGNPMPEVEWQVWSEKKKTFVALSVSPKSTKHSVSKREKNALAYEYEYSLCIFSVQEEDTRLYRCLATSAPFESDDRVYKVFNLTFAPSVPALRVDSSYIFADACNISWYSVASNVTHYFLEIRLVDESKLSRWHSIELKQCPTRAYRLLSGSASGVSSRQHVTRNFTGTHIFSRLTPNSTYQVRVAACFANHCSPYTTALHFLTKDSSHVAPSWFTDLKQRPANENDAVGYYLSAASVTRCNALLQVALAALFVGGFGCAQARWLDVGSA